MGFSERLKAARDKRGWTQKELAEHAGVSVVTVQNCESGSGVNSKTIVRIAKALQVSIDYLLLDQESDSMVPEPGFSRVAEIQESEGIGVGDPADLIVEEALRQLGIDASEFTSEQLNVFRNQVRAELKNVTWTLKESMVAFRNK